MPRGCKAGASMPSASSSQVFTESQAPKACETSCASMLPGVATTGTHLVLSSSIVCKPWSCCLSAWLQQQRRGDGRHHCPLLPCSALQQLMVLAADVNQCPVPCPQCRCLPVDCQCTLLAGGIWPSMLVSFLPSWGSIGGAAGSPLAMSTGGRSGCDARPWHMGPLL